MEMPKIEKRPTESGRDRRLKLLTDLRHQIKGAEAAGDAERAALLRARRNCLKRITFLELYA